MADYKLNSPNLRVLRGSLDAPELIEIQTLNPDLILWDRTRMKHKWPEVKDAPMMWLTFLSWAACRREGRIPLDLTYEKWEATTLDVAPVNDDDEDDVRPTLPGPEPG
jgi:hypothetical protein